MCQTGGGSRVGGGGLGGDNKLIFKQTEHIFPLHLFYMHNSSSFLRAIGVPAPVASLTFPSENPSQNQETRRNL